MDLVERVKAIVLTPKSEWPVIEREPGDVGHLFGNYVAILAAIPAVCRLVGLLFAGASLGVAVMSAVLSYLLTFVGVYVAALIVDALAPTFSGQKNMANALKLASYAPTPYWIAGILLLVPGLRILTLLAALYTVYLLWVGLPILMRSPEDKTVSYLGAVIGVTIVIGIVIGLIVGAVVGFSLLV